MAETLMELALGHHRAGRLDEAAILCRRVLQAEPRNVDALHLLGILLRRQGRLSEAISSYRQALAIAPRHLASHHNLGQALRAANDLAGAAACFRKVLDLDPAQGEAAAALAEVLLNLGRAAEAIPLFERALARFPEDGTLYAGLGDAHHALAQLPPAVAAYQRAVTLDPALGRAWWGLGCAQLTQAAFAAAVPALRRVVELVPDFGEAWQNLGKALYQLGQIEPALDAFRQAAALLRPNDVPLCTIATIIPGSPRSDNAAVLEARRQWAPVAAAPKAWRRPVGTEGQRLRIGYLSSFFQDRNWMKPVWGLVNHHDRERFEIHLFSEAPASRIRHGWHQDPRDRFHDISGLANADVAGLIEAQGIDVLVDLNAYSRAARLPLFALRPAPVLVAWFNAFATSGLTCFDALIGDEHVLPATDEAFYTEPIVRLPICYLTFEVTYPVPEVAPAPCRSRGHVTFGCLAPQYKITPDVMEAWSRILAGVPGSRLVLKNVVLAAPDNRRFVLDQFARCNVAPERIDLSGPAEHFAFLEQYAAIDLALDTFPYNGGTTTMEALWQGVPVLTFPGDRWASRISASMLRYAGLPEFIGPDQEGFVRLAVALANDPATPAHLDELRQAMRERLRCSPLCDVQGLTRAMEREYLRLWRDRQGAR